MGGVKVEGFRLYVLIRSLAVTRYLMDILSICLPRVRSLEGLSEVRGGLPGGTGGAAPLTGRGKRTSLASLVLTFINKHVECRTHWAIVFPL